MATSTISIKYRPIRIAFLVEEGKINDLVKSAGINTLLWGGIYNPVIPVSKNNRKYVDSLLELFNIDVFYKVSETDEINKIVEENQFFRDPSHIGEKIFYEDWHTKKNALAYLDSKNIVDLYWKKEFKHKPKTYKSNCAFIKWDKKDKYSNLFSLLFGYFPNSYNLKHDFQNAFIKGLKSKNITITKANNLAKEIPESITPIIATGLELNGYGGSWRSDGIYIGDENNFTDLLNFWNLRASGIRIEFLPKNGFSKFKNFIQTYISKLDTVPNKNPNIDDWINIYYQGDQKSIQTIVNSLKTKNKRFCYSHCDEISWNGLNIKPSKFYFNWQQVLASTEKEFDKYSVSLTLPEKKFLSDNYDNFQSLVAVVDPITEFTHPRHTLKLPFIRKLNEFYSREVKFDPWKLRVEQDEIGIIIKANDNHLSLFPIHHEKIIKKVFELAGFKSKISQAGLLAQQIISNMREHSPLEACRVFKITGVRELIKSLKASDFITWSKATKIIWDNNFKKFEKLYIEQRDKTKLDTQSTFNFLIKKNIFAPKLKIMYKIFTPKRKFKCRKCGLNEKIKIDNFEKKWVCPYCNYKHSMPQYIKEDLQGVVNKYFKFYKTGLFSKDNNQEGAIPVILTLLTLKRIFHGSDIFYSTSLELKNSKKCEVDFTALNIKHGKIEFGIAECKSKGQIINKQDIDNLKYIQDKIQSLNIDCYIIFSKTNDSFEDSELKLFKELKKQNRKIILLTNNEIEPYNPYWELDKTDQLPRKYAFSIEDMYRNSMFLYLNE